MHIVFMVLFVICCLLLILLILVQKGRGAGLAGAFGGAGGHSAFGTKTADVLTKITAGLAAAFFLLSVATAMYLKHYGPMAGIERTPAGQTGDTGEEPAPGTSTDGSAAPVPAPSPDAGAPTAPAPADPTPPPPDAPTGGPTTENTGG